MVWLGTVPINSHEFSVNHSNSTYGKAVTTNKKSNLHKTHIYAQKEDLKNIHSS